MWSAVACCRADFEWLDHPFFGLENGWKIMRFQTLFEGRWIFAILLILAIACAFFSLWLSLVFVALILYTLAFFRDPNRSDPSDQCAVVAAADGTVADVEEVDEKEFLKARTRRVGIFLSIFDVHTNRAPVAGRIAFQQFRKGLFFDARRPECSDKNEAMTWAFQNPRATIVVRQLTGAIARRIVGWAKVGDELKRGERFGMIRFGSRTEVYLPLDAEILVRVGDHVKGGASVIARLPE
ncbi:MAG: phosphatidylserine decarboxylase family protein [Verrucomicrobia bacterium]|nr:MAG: phosphatidylserine decarboxylase family protein [Verrucomicrobiota bacterium]